MQNFYCTVTIKLWITNGIVQVALIIEYAMTSQHVLQSNGMNAPDDTVVLQVVLHNYEYLVTQPRRKVLPPFEDTIAQSSSNMQKSLYLTLPFDRTVVIYVR